MTRKSNITPRRASGSRSAGGLYPAGGSRSDAARSTCGVRGAGARLTSGSRAVGSRSVSGTRARTTSANFKSEQETNKVQFYAKKQRRSKKKIIIVSLVVVFAAVALWLGIDVLANLGKIHSGVTVQGIDVGGLTKQEATTKIESDVMANISAAPVVIYRNPDTLALGDASTSYDLAALTTTYKEDFDPGTLSSWTLTPAVVGATVDSKALAEQAYNVGRGWNFLTGRLGASFSGVQINAALSYDNLLLESLETMLTLSIGWNMQNAGISFSDGAMVVVDGKEGYVTDHSKLVEMLDAAFLGADKNIVVPMVAKALDITHEDAQVVATRVTELIAEPVELVYKGDEMDETWTLESHHLGPWVDARVEGLGQDAVLVPFINAERLETDIHEIIGGRDPGVKPVNAHFEVVGDKLEIIPSKKGTGIDYAALTGNLDSIIFAASDSTLGVSYERRITLTVSELDAEFTEQSARDLNINSKIASYTTEYGGSSAAKSQNIALASDLLNNSLIAPGEVWSFHETAGECNAQAGFQEATAIVNGEYVDEIGGGICQVATTIFNAVFDSGLPVAERVNHSFYLIAYPAGRDAAVSWMWPDLKFENDTGAHVLLTMQYTGSSLTCTLWGTDPGYRVETTDTGFTDRTDFETEERENPELEVGERKVKQVGVKGRTIVVTRYVYNAQGELIRETAFKSIYQPETEIVEIGTKEASDKPEDGNKEEEGNQT